MPTTLDGDTVQEVTIDGQTVQEITVDGDVVFTASTETITLVDSYEHGDLSGHYSTLNSNYSITSNFATDASNGLEYTNATGTGGARSESSDGLPNYPSKPTTIRVDMETDTSAANASSNLRIGPVWGVASSTDYYFMQILVSGSPHLQMWKRTSANGFETVGSSVSLSDWQADTTYTAEIEWDDGATFGGSDGDMNFRIYQASDGTEITSGSINDTDNNGSGIGYRTEHGDTSYVTNYDYYRYAE